MKYFFDTEFLEGPQKKLFGYTKPTIDLISIGIVAEDGREYYAISKDFNLKEAWNRFQVDSYDRMGNLYSNPKKIYWIRENVLKPIFVELWEAEKDAKLTDADFNGGIFTFGETRRLIKTYGKLNKQISGEIMKFTLDPTGEALEDWLGGLDEYVEALKTSSEETVEFYAYYADYDWVVFCWLFGKMIDLPKSFPMYCRDLQQIKDEVFEKRLAKGKENFKDFELPPIKTWNDYPSQENEHNALDDARWTLKLYKFIMKHYGKA